MNKAYTEMQIDNLIRNCENGKGLCLKNPVLLPLLDLFQHMRDELEVLKQSIQGDQ